jgi:isopentenyl diphosphate isomerase/L-lactate dehydrogenase-like FMN-dependent dehydrogenase
VGAPFAQAAVTSTLEVEGLIEKYAMELKTAMFGVGASSLKELQAVKLYIS